MIDRLNNARVFFLLQIGEKKKGEEEAALPDLSDSEGEGEGKVNELRWGSGSPYSA